MSDAPEKAFCFSGQQWARIAAELPRGCDHEQIRSFVELVASSHIRDLNDPQSWRDRRNESKRRHEVARLAGELRAKLVDSTELVHLVDTNQWGRLNSEEAKVQLGDLYECADFFFRVLDLIEARARDLSEADDKLANFQARNARHKHRFFYQMILTTWLKAGGRMKFSRGSGTSKKTIASGPLIRYVQAVTEPVLGTDAIGPERIAEFITERRADLNSIRDLGFE
jgi:hypothetical protein